MKPKFERFFVDTCRWNRTKALSALLSFIGWCKINLSNCQVFTGLQLQKSWGQLSKIIAW